MHHNNSDGEDIPPIHTYIKKLYLTVVKITALIVKTVWM